MGVTQLIFLFPLIFIYLSIHLFSKHWSVWQMSPQLGCGDLKVLKIAKYLLWRNKRRFNYRGGPGGRLNKKDGLTRYGDSHVKDKTS